MHGGSLSLATRFQWAVLLFWPSRSSPGLHSLLCHHGLPSAGQMDVAFGKHIALFCCSMPQVLHLASSVAGGFTSYSCPILL